MHVRIPSAQLASLYINMEGARNRICVLSSEDLLQSFSMEHMHQIRKIMIQHEELFKEQVRALHRLYNVQKSAMEEIERIICHRNGIPNGEVRISVLERKATIKHNFPALSYMGGNCSLVDRELTITGATKPLFGANREHEYLPETQKGRIRLIDLEKPPEEYMDELECQLEAKDGEEGSKQQAFQQDTLQKLPYNTMLSTGKGAAHEESKITLKSPKMFPSPLQPQDPVEIRVCSSDLQLEDKSGSSHNSSSVHKRAELNVAGSQARGSFPIIFPSDSTADSGKCGMAFESAQENSVKMGQAQFGLKGESQLCTRDSGYKSMFCAHTETVNENAEVCLNNQQKTPTELIASTESSETEYVEEGVVTIRNDEEPEGATLEEECDTIAANILLSFMPCRSESSSPKWQCLRTQIKSSPSQSNRSGTGRSEKMIRSERTSCNSVCKDPVVRLRRPIHGRRRNARI